jgi:hypothetical protein
LIETTSQILHNLNSYDNLQSERKEGLEIFVWSTKFSFPAPLMYYYKASWDERDVRDIFLSNLSNSLTYIFGSNISQLGEVSFQLWRLEERYLTQMSHHRRALRNKKVFLAATGHLWPYTLLWNLAGQYCAWDMELGLF